jgi:glycosyltransferase involved in cell wall biosynthesis
MTCIAFSDSRPLKIAHLALTALPATVGGLEIVVRNLIAQQRAAGHRVHLVTRWKQGIAARAAGERDVHLLPPRLAADKVPFRSVGPRWPAALAVRLIQLRQRFDVWHLHWVYPTGWLAHDALRAMRVPVVITAHGADLLTDPELAFGYRQVPLHDRRIRELLPRADALTAISASMEHAYRDLGARPATIERISNGVDFARLAQAREARTQTRATLGIGPQTTLVLSVGRNQPSKGFQYIPEMLRLLKDRDRDVVWFVVGRNTDQLAPALEQAGVAHLARLLPACGADGSGHFPPERLARLYAAADVFAFPSLNEGFGLVALEAMAAGVPVVGNDVSGIRDVVTHGTDGLLCPSANPEAMVEAIASLLDRKDYARRLGEAGMRKAKAHDWAAVAGQFCDLYRCLIGGAA